MHSWVHVCVRLYRHRGADGLSTAPQIRSAGLNLHCCTWAVCVCVCVVSSTLSLVLPLLHHQLNTIQKPIDPYRVWSVPSSLRWNKLVSVKTKLEMMEFRFTVLKQNHTLRYVLFSPAWLLTSAPRNYSNANYVPKKRQGGIELEK